MPWGRVDDHHYRHAKVLELHAELRKGCLALFWLTISWCNDNLTDGRVPPGTVRLLGAEPEEADELVRVGMWEADARGFRVHDFLDFNKSKAQVEADRKQRTEAGKLGAQARWHGGSPDDSPNGSSVGSLGASVDESVDEMDAPSPVSRNPSTTAPEPDARASREEWDEPEFEARQWLSKHGCYIRAGNGYDQKLVLAVEHHGINAMVGMLDRLSSAGVRDGDIKGLLFGAIDALDAQTRPNLVDFERGLRDEERAAARRNRRPVGLQAEIVAAMEAREKEKSGSEPVREAV